VYPASTRRWRDPRRTATPRSAKPVRFVGSRFGIGGGAIKIPPMRLFKREGVQPLTANEAIKETYRGPELQQLFVSLIGGKPPSRRDDAAAALLKLLDHDRLEASVGKLSDRERGMVAEAAWS
jgi:hypothetical protein